MSTKDRRCEGQRHFMETRGSHWPHWQPKRMCYKWQWIRRHLTDVLEELKIDPVWQNCYQRKTHRSPHWRMGIFDQYDCDKEEITPELKERAEELIEMQWYPVYRQPSHHYPKRMGKPMSLNCCSKQASKQSDFAVSTSLVFQMRMQKTLINWTWTFPTLTCDTLWCDRYYSGYHLLFFSILQERCSLNWLMLFI